MIPSAIARPHAPHLRTAAFLLVAYGLLVVLNATAMQMAAEWRESADYTRAFLRCGVAVALAWGVMHRNVWAWRFAVGLSAFWSLAAALGLLLLAESGAWDRLPLPGWWIGFSAVSFALLAGAVAALLAPSTRAEFQR